MYLMTIFLLYVFCHISQREDIIKLIKEICGKTVYCLNRICNLKHVVWSPDS